MVLALEDQSVLSRAPVRFRPLNVLMSTLLAYESKTRVFS
jgi:hypothetical protein